MRSPNPNTSAPLYQLRRLLAPTLAPGRPLVPITLIATACGLSPATWRRGEQHPLAINGITHGRILRALGALGYPLTPNHLTGYEPLPDPPPSIGDPNATLGALHAMLRSNIAQAPPSPPATLKEIVGSPDTTPTNIVDPPNPLG